MTQHQQPDLRALDGLRGVAAVVVVVGHILTYFVPRAADWTRLDTPSPPPPATGAPPGPAAPPAFGGGARYPAVGLEYLSPVTRFFVISGFTRVHVYEKPPRAGEPPPLSTPAQRWQFYRKRVARLAPVYYAGLLLGVVPFVVTFLWAPGLLAIGFPVSLLGLQSLVLYNCQNWDGPLWTVSAFVFCYLLFPRLLQRMRKLSNSGLHVAAFGCAVLSAAIGIGFTAGAGLNLGTIVHFFAPFRFPQFALGMAHGLLAQRVTLQHATLYAEALSLLMAANIAACAGMTARMAPDVAYTSWMIYCQLAEFLLPWFHSAWLWALTAAGGGGPTRALLSSRPLRALGDISYSLYCVHFPVLQWAVYAVAHGVSFDAGPIKAIPRGPMGFFAFPTYAIVPLLAVAAAVAALVHQVLERPARTAIAQRGSAGATASAQPGAAAAVPLAGEV